MPGAEELPERVDGVLATIYLIFTEGHAPRAGAAAWNGDLCDEAVRLARLVHALLPEDPEVRGLLALLRLADARRLARTVDGRLVLLADQDRGRWDAAAIAEGVALVRACVREGRPGPYQLQAAIPAVHAVAPSAATTDWAAIVQLYDQLVALTGSPVAAMHSAVAVAELRGPAAGLAALDACAEVLADSHRLHAIRGELLARQGYRAEAARALHAALDRVENGVERAHLEARLAALGVE